MGVIIVRCAMRVDGHGQRFAKGGDSGSAVLAALGGGADTWRYTYKYSTATRIVGLFFGSENEAFGADAFFSPISAVSSDLGNITNFY